MLAFLLLPVVALGAATQPASVQTAVVVERVEPKSAADEAGLSVGDVLVSWRAAPVSAGTPGGRFQHPRDVDSLEAEQHRVGPVVVSVQRGAASIEVRPRVALAWGLETGLALPADGRGSPDVRDLAALHNIQALVQAKRIPEALALRDEALKAGLADWWF